MDVTRPMCPKLYLVLELKNNFMVTQTTPCLGAAIYYVQGVFFNGPTQKMLRMAKSLKIESEAIQKQDVKC